jgi:hypothetical protein
MPIRISPQRLSLVLAALLLSLAPAEAKLDRDIQRNERQACEQAAEGKVDRASRVCRCMAEGLSDALDDEDYAALARLIHLGEESEAGLAAQETARAVVAQCLAG